MGLATLAGLLVGATTAPAYAHLRLIVAVSAGMAIIGFVDDVRSLSVRVRFALQIFFGLLLGCGFVQLFGLGWWVVPIVAVLFAGFVNMSNFMDGANGISALYGASAGVAFTAIGFITHRGWLMTIGMLIGVAFLVFLPWNVLGIGMFLGDCGSYLLGSTVAATSAGALLSGVPWPAAIAPLAVYATDTSWAVLSRVIRGERWWEAHRQHHYQQLIDSGSSHVSAAVTLATFVVLASSGGMIALLDFRGASLVAIGAVVLVCCAYALGIRLAINIRRRVSA